MNVARFLFLNFLALATIALSSCDGPAGHAYDLPDKQQPALWRIVDPDSGRVGYVIGTLHMLPRNVRWMTPQIKRAVAQAGVLITEIDAESAADNGFDAMAADEPVIPLSKRMDGNAFGQAKSLAEEHNISLTRLNSLESWAAMLVMMQAKAQGLSVSTSLGVETQLRAAFESEGKPLLPLETATDQYARFDGLPDEVQNAMLARSVQPSDPRAEFQIMLTAWLSGDLVALERISLRGIMADAALREALLHEPNAQWSAKIAASASQGQKPFVAIGAAHLVGDRNVLGKLEADGWRIERLQ